VCVSVSAEPRLLAALVSAAKVMRCIQCSFRYILGRLPLSTDCNNKLLIICRYNQNDLTHGVLYWGDERGNVSAVEFKGCRDMCFFSVSFLSFSFLRCSTFMP